MTRKVTIPELPCRTYWCFIADDGYLFLIITRYSGEENCNHQVGVHLNLCQEVHEGCSEFVNYDVKLYLFNGESLFIAPLTTVPVDENHNAQLCFDTRKNVNQSIQDNGFLITAHSVVTITGYWGVLKTDAVTGAIVNI
jgi:hypothetical protein